MRSADFQRAASHLEEIGDHLVFLERNGKIALVFYGLFCYTAEHFLKNAEDQDRFSLTAIVGDVLLVINNSHDSYPLPLRFSFLFDFLRFGAFSVH